MPLRWCLALAISGGITQCGAIAFSIARVDALVQAQALTQLDIESRVYRA